MNSHIYQIIWNANLDLWVVASELTKTGKKRNSVRRKALVILLLSLCSSVSFALPTGSEVISGQVTISTPAAGHLHINQSNQNAIINWQGFSIGTHEVVNIQQPNAHAVQLDRVVGQDPSVIQGQLTSNGQIFLVNPNGVIFSKTAQVDVGGLVASTHSISNADFANGKLHFTQDGAKGSVSNQGQINTPNGGVVAFIGEQIENSGTIRTPQGSTVLAAGKTVDLDMKGDGLVEVKVTEAALNAQITNNGVIQAEGGQVIMTAQSASQLLKTVINNEGVVEARGLVEKNGSIVLSGGDNGMVEVGGTLDVSGQAVNGNGSQSGSITVSGAQIQVNNNAVLNASGDAGGGAIAIGDKQSTNQASIKTGAKLEAKTLNHGKAGSIAVFANMDNGQVSVAGQLNASAPKQGDGGFIETSAKTVNIADTAKISTSAANGNQGQWLIDPYDFTIAASGGNITGTALSLALNSNSVQIQTTSGGTSCSNATCTTGNTGTNGDININDVVNWSANTLLLNAFNNININANLNASGTASLALYYGQGAVNAGNSSNVATHSGAAVNLPASTTNFTTKQGSDGAIQNYTVITSLGSEGDETSGAATLQGMAAAANLGLNFALGTNIDASPTSGWNGGTGFTHIGYADLAHSFQGSFNGLGHTITGLTINTPTINREGLFGYARTSSIISNVGLVDVNITGLYQVGALVGEYVDNGLPTGNFSIVNSYATGRVAAIGDTSNPSFTSAYVGGLVGVAKSGINNSYTTCTVSGTGNYVGGLVGVVEGTGSLVSNSYATGSVTGTVNLIGTGSFVGGLVGASFGTINNSYATGNVSGPSVVGGLVGALRGPITNSYSTGNVSGSTQVGGLAGESTGTIANSYSTGNVSGSTQVGGLVGRFTSGTITNSFWDVQSSGRSSSEGGIGVPTNAAMMQLATYSTWGTSISNTGASGAVWRIYEGHTFPLLTSFMTSLTLTYAPDVSLAYNGLLQSGPSTAIRGVLGTAATGTNAGFYNGYYSTQQGYNIIGGNLTITPAPAPPPVNPPSDLVIGQFIPVPVIPAAPSNAISSSEGSVSSLQDTTSLFTGSPTNQTKQNLIKPTLKIKNGSGPIKQIRMDSHKHYLSLLLDNGEVRIWDFRDGLQRQIATPNPNLLLTDISAVNDKGEFLSVAGKTGIGTYDLIGLIPDDKFSINEPDTYHFTASNDGKLLLIHSEPNALSLWDNNQSKKLWDLPYQRGVVNAVVMSDNKDYGAVLSRQPDSYVLPRDLKLQTVTDAVDIIDLANGQVIKSLPNLGEQVVYIQFKDNDTLQLGLANGELLEWPTRKDNLIPIADFAEIVTSVDVVTNTYAYILNDGTVRVGNGKGHPQLSVKNENNPFKFAKLLEGDKKLLTIMANGELSVWDVASGVKMLRLFSTKQGWTAMDAFGRFDGSEEALDNFTWAANEIDIPLDSFSENYYEPGLVGNVLHNQDYLNRNPLMVKEGITLPPKVNLELDEQQTTQNNVVAQLDVFERGGGIKQINIYQNGKLLNNEDVIASQQILSDNKTEHRHFTLNVMPTGGKNTLKVIASNDMGIENSSTELSFQSQSKASISPIHILTVGIDNYSDNSLDLDYSVSDANAISQAIKNNSSIATSKSLYNENATKARILAELKEFSQGNPQDTLIIYFAGHGLAIDKEWYFLPYETKMQSTPEQVAAWGVSSSELKDIFKDAKMQHIIVMIDSCYSGQAADSFDTLQIGQHYFTRSLSRSLGITMISAAAKDKEAYEAKSLGHGLFSYLMSQDIEKPDADHSAHGIAENIVKTLPAFSKKIVGVSQEPVVYTKGHNFMLTGAGNE